MSVPVLAACLLLVCLCVEWVWVCCCAALTHAHFGLQAAMHADQVPRLLALGFDHVRVCVLYAG
jgi:hypothetical protein